LAKRQLPAKGEGEIVAPPGGGGFGAELLPLHGEHGGAKAGVD
jgi:hypothetical protein